MNMKGGFLFIEHSGDDGGVTRKERTSVRRHIAHKLWERRFSEDVSYSKLAKDNSQILENRSKSDNRSVHNELCGDKSGRNEPKLDPLSLLPIAPGNYRERQLIHHISARLWPGFRQNFKQIVNPFSAYWLPRSFEDPPLYSSFLFAALCHQTSRLTLVGRRPEVQNELTRLQMRTIRGVRAQINSCEIPMSAEKMEVILMMTICLATNVQGQELLADRDPTPFFPVLTSSRWLDTYGAFACHNVHWNAVVQLLKRIGGIENINSFGLPWVISCAGLIVASTTLSPPPTPLLNVNGAPPQMMSYAEISPGDTWQDCRLCMGTGFHVLKLLGLSEEIKCTFASLGEFSSILDAYCSGRISKFDMEDILDSREVVIHSLLSLPPSIEVGNAPFILALRPKDEWLVQCLYRVCRLAAQLYGVMVIFPIPHSKGAREFAVSQIEHLLSSLPFFTNSHGLLRLDLWCTVIAGSSCASKSQRDWYRKRARNLAELLDIRDWQELEEALSDFGWVPHICSASGYGFLRGADESGEGDFVYDFL